MSTSDLGRTLLFVVAIILMVPLLMMVVMMPMMVLWGGGHMWDGTMWGPGATWAWLLMWLVLLVVVVGLGYLFYRAADRSRKRDTDPALGALRLAYARGELTDEEFEQRRERLVHEE